MNSTSSKPNQRPARHRTSGLWLVFCGLALLAGCSTQTRHKWLTVFFDGVPPLGGVTNAPAASAHINNVSAANQNAQAARPTAPATIPGSSHPPFNHRDCDVMP